MTAELLGEIRERPEMYEKPRLFDDLGLVALPTAVSCARLFTQYTLSNWGASPFVVADAVVIAGELTSVVVQETGILADEVRWSELDHVNRVVVRLLAFRRHIVVEVWDAATKPAALPADDPHRLPTGLHLVDVTAHRWGSMASRRGRLTWAAVTLYERAESGLPIRLRRPGDHQELTAPLVDEGLLRRVRDGLERL